MLKAEGSNPGASIRTLVFSNFQKMDMAMHFSFEYCIDPKDHKSLEEIKATAVECAIRPKLQPDAMQDGGVPPEH